MTSTKHPEACNAVLAVAMHYQHRNYYNALQTLGTLQCIATVTGLVAPCSPLQWRHKASTGFQCFLIMVPTISDMIELNKIKFILKHMLMLVQD